MVRCRKSLGVRLACLSAILARRLHAADEGRQGGSAAESTPMPLKLVGVKELNIFCPFIYPDILLVWFGLKFHACDQTATSLKPHSCRVMSQLVP